MERGATDGLIAALALFPACARESSPPAPEAMAPSESLSLPEAGFALVAPGPEWTLSAREGGAAATGPGGCRGEVQASPRPAEPLEPWARALAAADQRAGAQISGFSRVPFGEYLAFRYEALAPQPGAEPQRREVTALTTSERALRIVAESHAPFLSARRCFDAVRKAVELLDPVPPPERRP